ncbi:MAG: EexN family lipoprotein [Gammaproteobacteria bacterium]|nr:EexN family lipoprotein [Gammaproteobacteria bacterium]
MNPRITLLAVGITLVCGCAKEQPPRSVNEFLENPIMLEAAMVRCARDRSATRYDAECINAREAVSRIEAKEEAARQIDLDARSESKRQALRRAQGAAAEARRRSAEAKRKREEAEYLAQFGVLPPVPGDSEATEITGNTPVAVLPEGDGSTESNAGGSVPMPVPATDGGNAPEMTTEPEEDASDLASIRDELRRRSEDDGS